MDMNSQSPNAIDWLLEMDNPSVRAFALQDLMNLPAGNPQVQQAKSAVMQTGLVPGMLSLMETPDYIKTYPQFYTNKYKGVVWSLLTLAELGATRNDQIEALCEYMFANSQENEDGGFAMHTAAKTGGGKKTEVIPCLVGNMVFSLIRLGYLDDPRAQKAIDWINRFMRYNDGEENDPQTPPYDHYEMCWGKHTCHMGVVKTLKALAEIPEEKRSAVTLDTIQRASEFLLIHHIHKQSHNLKKTSKPGWLKFGFPLMYQTDILEILDILTSLGFKDPRMDEAIQVVISKRDESGCWKIENTYGNDRLLIPMEKAGEQSKWLTLRALRVFERYYGSDLAFKR